MKKLLLKRLLVLKLILLTKLLLFLVKLIFLFCKTKYYQKVEKNI